MGIVTWWGATGAGDGVVNKVPEKQSGNRVNTKCTSMVQCMT